MSKEDTRTREQLLSDNATQVNIIEKLELRIKGLTPIRIREFKDMEKNARDLIPGFTAVLYLGLWFYAIYMFIQNWDPLWFIGIMLVDLVVTQIMRNLILEDEWKKHD